MCACPPAVCLAFRPQPPRCRVVGPSSLLLVVDVTQAVRLPVAPDVGFPLTAALVIPHPDKVRLVRPDRAAPLRRGSGCILSANCSLHRDASIQLIFWPWRLFLVKLLGKPGDRKFTVRFAIHIFDSMISSWYGEVYLCPSEE